MLLISTGDLAFADMLRQVDSSTTSAILEAIDQTMHFYEVKMAFLGSRLWPSRDLGSLYSSRFLGMSHAGHLQAVVALLELWSHRGPEPEASMM